MLDRTAKLALVALTLLGGLAGCDSDETGGGGQGGAGAGAAGGGGADGSGGGGGGGSGSGGAPAVCDPPLAEVAPSGTDDAVYADVPESRCFESTCLCGSAARSFIDDVLACNPVAGGAWGPGGSVYLRVAGREGGACVLEVGEEIEGGVKYSRCLLPLPITPWPGIATQMDSAVDGDSVLVGLDGQCETVGNCCVLPGCPGPCDTQLPDVPLCPANKPAQSCD